MQTTYMRQCTRCKKLFCRDCMTPDVATGDPTNMLCLHCARRVVSPKQSSPWTGLENHLKFRAAFTDTVTLKFARIDGLIGTNLPMAAYRDPLYWSNNSASAHAKAWLNVGWEVHDVNFKEGTVTFRKVREPPRQPKKKTIEATKPFTPIPVRPLRSSKPPSKTKVSKLYARIKNLERQRQSPQPLRGLKGRPQPRRLTDNKPQ